VTKNSIDSEWRSFSEQAIPHEASAESRMFARKLFYAGALSMFKVLKQTSSSDDKMITIDRTTIDSLSDEIRKFCDTGIKEVT